MTYDRTKLTALLIGAMAAASCQDDPPPRRPPPPPPNPAAASCDAPRRVNDARNLEGLPDKTGGFCLDPNGSDRGYGDGAKNPLDGIRELFDGESEIYLGLQVKRVVEARYVDGRGGGATIDVKLSTFASESGAFGMFTKRVVGDGDPAHPDTPRPIAGGGAAALGIGNAYLWRGRVLAEITYNDDQASAKQIEAAANKLLPPFAQALGGKLQGPTELPASAAALPADKRLPAGIRLVTSGALGAAQSGEGAYGYYRDGDKRWRVLAMARPGEAEAKDALRALGAGAKEKGLGDEARRLVVGTSPKTEWVVARKGARVLGVGDEARVLRDGMTAGERHAVTLSIEQKRALLKKLLGS